MTTTRPRNGVTTRDYDGRYDVGKMIADLRAVITDLAQQATDSKAELLAKGELRVWAGTDFTQERAEDVARLLRYIAKDPASKAKDHTGQLSFYVGVNQGAGRQFGITATGKIGERFDIDLRNMHSILDSPMSAQEFVQRAIDAELKPVGAAVGA